MFKRDYIEKQLEQLALAIAKVISQITNTKLQGKPDSGITIADEFLRTEFDVELTEVGAILILNSHLLSVAILSGCDTSTGKGMNFSNIDWA